MLSAIGFLTSTIETTWTANSQCVVSMLNLENSGEFDYISHERLLFILRSKGILEAMVIIIKSFLNTTSNKNCVSRSPRRVYRNQYWNPARLSFITNPLPILYIRTIGRM